jgi:simple sugar transport system substrate-binding protein
MLRQRMVILMVAVFSALGLAGCGGVVQSGDEGGGGKFQLADYIRQDIENGEELVIRVSYHDTSLAFADPIREGVEQAAQELGVDAELVGPANGSAQEQVSELRTLISQQEVHGLAVSSASNDALKPVIAEAYEAGIPIISFNTNNPGSKQMAFVGQDLTESGKILAQELREQVLGDQKGKVVVFSVDTGAGWSHDRFSGFEEGMKGASGVQIEGPVNTGNEPRQAFNAVQNAMTGNQDAIAIASLDCCSVDAAATWAQQNNADTPIVGFDVLPQTAEFIRDGVIQFTISQNPSKQGFEAVRVLNDYLKEDKPINDVDTGAQIVDKSNIDEVPLEG